MILLISSKVAFAFDERLPISFRFSCSKSTVSTSSSEMALEMPESDESMGRTADVVVEVADDGHRSDVTDSSFVIFRELSLSTILLWTSDIIAIHWKKIPPCFTRNNVKYQETVVIHDNIDISRYFAWRFYSAHFQKPKNDSIVLLDYLILEIKQKFSFLCLTFNKTKFWRYIIFKVTSL